MSDKNSDKNEKDIKKSSKDDNDLNDKSNKNQAVTFAVVALAVVAICLLFLSSRKNKDNNSSSSPDASGVVDEYSSVDVKRYTFEEDESKSEYIKLEGLDDVSKQKNINDDIEELCLWWTKKSNNSNNENVISEVKYWVVKDKFLSVINEEEREFGGAHPYKLCKTRVYDLTTGEKAGKLSDFVNLSDEFKKTLATKTFKKVYPEGEIENQNDTLLENFKDDFDSFYLTKDGLGLVIDGMIHALGDYWRFEAEYKDIKPFLKQNLF
ncbi:MAG: hypothetical protein LBJ93_02255 [Clostridiales bacterium]|jgi:hypothetical protein|nr:hypothetical protein [Clostridiales bacterium]